MKIAKEFNWEMGHRLPEHFGKCKNIHGHSYKMLLELEGDIKPDGMVMDYYDLKKIINPIIEELDHCFLVNKNDTVVFDFLKSINSKTVVVGFDSTVENITQYLLDRIQDLPFPDNITKIKVRVFETPDDYAEDETYPLNNNIPFISNE